MRHSYEKLIWEDHFEKDSLDLSKWNYRYGNWIVQKDGYPGAPGWGNEELQYYTDSSANLWLKDSYLHIAARKELSPEQFGKRCTYTSSKIDTRDLFSFCYGRVEIRAKCPAGTGLWPAVWLLPQDNIYGPWAASGEIDIMEMKGRLPKQVYGTIHYGGVSPDKTHQEYCCLLSGKDAASAFHIYGLTWQPGRISWAVDGIEYASTECWESMTKGISFPQPFDQPFYLTINLAVGGVFDYECKGAVDDEALPGEFLIDYVRVYQ